MRGSLEANVWCTQTVERESLETLFRTEEQSRRGEKSVAVVGKKGEKELVILVQALPMRFSRWPLEFSARRSHVAAVDGRRVGAR